MIYLDVAATTRPSATAIREFTRVANNSWMNPSSKTYSVVAANELEAARETIAKCIGAAPGQIIFTSGSTEAANMVMAQNWSRILISPIEHPCVYEATSFPHILSVDCEGRIDFDYLIRSLDIYAGREILVAIMGANNEIGTVQNLNRIADVVHSYRNAYLFADNTQLWAHSSPALDGVDFACASAHKFGGFKGTGFLYAKDPTMLQPLLRGGHQEKGLRAGTENVCGIVAMAAAFEENCRLGFDGAAEINQLIRSLANDSGMKVNSPEDGLPNIVSVTMPDCGALEMIVALSMDEIYISAGSACTSGLLAPSRILKAIGMSDEDALRTLRISFDRKTRAEDIKTLFEKINNYREMLP